MVDGRGKPPPGNPLCSARPRLRAVGKPPNPDTSDGDSREVEALRLMNAHLRRELAALREREAEAQRLADRDDLTGLYNRRCMLEMLTSAIAEAGKLRHCVGLLFVDLNGFKR